MSTLFEAAKATWITETLENYPIAFQTGAATSTPGQGENNQIDLDEDGDFWDLLLDDRYFWNRILYNRNRYWGAEFTIRHCVYTDWIARVPGLYWAADAAGTRQLAERFQLTDPGIVGEGHRIYQPVGKSALVSGGMGTLKLPPNDRDYRIACVSTGANASSGIPVLISPEVLQCHTLEDGDEIEISSARWTKMSDGWLNKFPTKGNLPRGYLVVDKPEKIRKFGYKRNIAAHPFSVMEYQNDKAWLYDFVYVTVNAADPYARDKAIRFFERYRNANGYGGKYLLAVDPADPFFDARYAFPEDLERYDAGRTQLNLIKDRIKGTYFGEFTIDALMGIIPNYYPTANDISRIAINLGIGPELLPSNVSATKITAVLMEQVIRQDKMDLLVRELVQDNPKRWRAL